jgi:hypothetical protein
MKNKPEMTDTVDSLLGESSNFHDLNGYYVHGLDVSSLPLAKDWLERCHKIHIDAYTAYCLDVHDLAVSKLIAFRQKDLEFVRDLIRERYVQPVRMLGLLNSLALSLPMRQRIEDWIDKTTRALTGAPLQNPKKV